MFCLHYYDQILLTDIIILICQFVTELFQPLGIKGSGGATTKMIFGNGTKPKTFGKLLRSGRLSSQ